MMVKTVRPRQRRLQMAHVAMGRNKRTMLRVLALRKFSALLAESLDEVLKSLRAHHTHWQCTRNFDQHQPLPASHPSSTDSAAADNI